MTYMRIPINVCSGDIMCKDLTSLRSRLSSVFPVLGLTRSRKWVQKARVDFLEIHCWARGFPEGSVYQLGLVVALPYKVEVMGGSWLGAIGSYLSAQLNLTWKTFPWRVCTCGARLMVSVVQVCKLLFCLQFTSHELGLPDPQEPMDHMRLYVCWAPFVSVAKLMSGICIDVLAFCTHAPIVQLGFPL